MLYSLGLLLGDVARCKVTANTDADTWRSDDLKHGSDDALADSEIWFEETTGMTAGKNPFQIVTNVASTGTVNVNTAYGAAGPAAGLLFTIGNIGAAGFPHQQKFDALLMAMAEYGQFTRASALATLDTTNYLHTIPGTLLTIYGMSWIDGSSNAVDLPPSVWREAINRQDSTVYLPYSFSGGETLRLYGRTIFTPPNVDTLNYTTVATQRPSDIVRAAAGWIRSGQVGRAQQANAQALTNISMRRLRSTLLRNEIVLAEV
jgi:hypothetical protein